MKYFRLVFTLKFSHRNFARSRRKNDKIKEITLLCSTWVYRLPTRAKPINMFCDLFETNVQIVGKHQTILYRYSYLLS